MSANVVGKIDLSKVIKVKNTIDHNADDSVRSACVSLIRNRAATIDMLGKNVTLNPKRPLGQKLLGRIDHLKKAGFAILNG